MGRLYIGLLLVASLGWVAYGAWNSALCGIKGGVLVVAPLGVVCIDKGVIK